MRAKLKIFFCMYTLLRRKVRRRQKYKYQNMMENSLLDRLAWCVRVYQWFSDMSARDAFPSSGYNNLGVFGKALYISNGRRSVEGWWPFFGWLCHCRFVDYFLLQLHKYAFMNFNDITLQTTVKRVYSSIWTGTRQHGFVTSAMLPLPVFWGPR